MVEWRESGFIYSLTRCSVRTMDCLSTLLGEWVWLVGGVLREVGEWFIYSLTKCLVDLYYGPFDKLFCWRLTRIPTHAAFEVIS